MKHSHLRAILTAAATSAVVVATLTSLTLPAQAAPVGSVATPDSSAAEPQPSPSPSPSSTSLPRLKHYSADSFTAQARALPSSLGDAVQAQLGVTSAQFLAQGAEASSASSVLSALRSAGVSVRSATFDPSSGALSVAVPDTAQARLVTSTGAQATVGTVATPAISTAKLKLQAATDPSLATGLHGGTGYYFNLADGSGVVECSVGFNGFTTTTRTPSFLTAGHCDDPTATGDGAITGGAQTMGTATRDGNITPASSTTIGNPIAGSFSVGGGYDSGLVSIGSTIAAGPDVTTWGGGTNQSIGTDTVNVVGATSAINGMQVCRSGVRSGWQCGIVLGADVSAGIGVSDTSNKQLTVNSFVTSACSQEGDSGGSFLSGQFAIGTLSGGSFPDWAGSGQDNECTSSLSSTNNAAATAWLKSPTASGCVTFYCTTGFPLKSATTKLDVAHQQPNWQLGVYLATPTVTASSQSSVAGTVALNSGTGAAEPTSVTVTLTPGGGTATSYPGVAVSQSTGAWSLAFSPAVPAGTAVTVQAVTSTAGYTLSTSAVGSGTIAATITKLPVNRIAGIDRYATAVAAAQQSFPKGASTVLLASGLNYPDALAAAPAAVKLGGPVLLTDPNSLTASTLAELNTLKPKKVIVLGTTAAVSAAAFSAVQTKVSSKPTVVRIGGVDRFATSQLLASYVWGTSAPTVFVASGLNSTDAEAAGPAAAKLGAPLLLVNGTASLDAGTTKELAALGTQTANVVGSTTNLSATVYSALSSRVHSISRTQGNTPAAVSVAVSSVFFPSASQVYLATDSTFPDGLVGAALAGQSKVPLLLTDPTAASAGIAAEITRLGATRINVLGSNVTISDATMNAIETEL